METLLQRLSEISPGRLLGITWMLLIPLFALAGVPIVGGVATAVTLLIGVGFPYLIVLGLPVHIVRPTVRRRARILFKGLLLVAVAVAFLSSLNREGVLGSEEPMGPVAAFLFMTFMAAFIVVVFAPCFLATAALNDARRSMRGGPSEPSIADFVALYFWLFGGVFRIHPQIQVVLHAA